MLPPYFVLDFRENIYRMVTWVNAKRREYYVYNPKQRVFRNP